MVRKLPKSISVTRHDTRRLSWEHHFSDSKGVLLRLKFDNSYPAPAMVGSYVHEPSACKTNQCTSIFKYTAVLSVHHFLSHELFRKRTPKKFSRYRKSVSPKFGGLASACNLVFRSGPHESLSQICIRALQSILSLHRFVLTRICCSFVSSSSPTMTQTTA